MPRKLMYKGVRVRNVIPRLVKNEDRTKVKRFYNISFNSPFGKDAPKDLIVMYDIPDSLKKERDWFRRQLIKFDYKMIQRSVWIGPSPLPKEFIKYLRDIKIGGKFKTFKLAKAQVIKSQL